MQTTTSHDISAFPLHAQDTLVSEAYSAALAIMDAQPGGARFVGAIMATLNEPTPTAQLAALCAVVAQMRSAT